MKIIVQANGAVFATHLDTESVTLALYPNAVAIVSTSEDAVRHEGAMPSWRAGWSASDPRLTLLEGTTP